MTNSPRIQKICELVDKSIIAEIGCDHAYITKNLLSNKKIKYAYLTDISSKCLEKAINNLSNYKDNTSFSVGNGLEALEKVETKKQIEQVIIAGMGGQEIIKILSQKESKNYSSFILQPQRNVLLLREYLVENKFKIISDEIVREGKLFYFVLKVEKSQTPTQLTTLELYFGKPTNKQVLKEYLEYELEKRKNISSQKKFIENETLIRLIEQYLQSL